MNERIKELQAEIDRLEKQMPKLIEQAFINIEGVAEPKVYWKFWEMVAILYMFVIDATIISTLCFISFFLNNVEADFHADEYVGIHKAEVAVKTHFGVEE